MPEKQHTLRGTWGRVTATPPVRMVGGGSCSDQLELSRSNNRRRGSRLVL